MEALTVYVHLVASFSMYSLDALLCISNISFHSTLQDIPTNGLAEMLNCRFFLAAQANPHIVPFFFESKGDVGRPSRWSSGLRDDSWRGGFILSALEMYLKNDFRSKFHFLNDLEVAWDFTSTMTTQTYSGSTTIVPQVCLKDYLLVRVNFIHTCNSNVARTNKLILISFFASALCGSISR